MNRVSILRAAAISGGIGVALGAFGAHGLQDSVPPADLEIWNTAVRYQVWHALALLAGAVVPRELARTGGAAVCWLLGTIVFSGSLYALVLSDLRWLGAITPIGGVLLLAGWMMLAVGTFQKDAPA